VQLDSTLAMGYAMLSISAMALEYDIPASTELARRSVRLDPRLGLGRIMLGTDLMVIGKRAEGLAELRQAFERDTLDAVTTGVYLLGLFLERQPDSLAAVLPRAHALAPEDTREYTGLLDLLRGDNAAAVRRLSWSYYGGWAAGEYVGALVALGRQAEARAVVDSMVAAQAHGYFNPYAIGRGYIALGEPDSAFAWIERGYQQRTQWLIFMFFDPIFDPLRHDPRYLALTSRMRL
jgi:hypothetical protein